MKKISIAFVAALTLAAFGCKKKGGDCASTINSAVDRMLDMQMKGGDMDKMSPDMKKQAEAMMKEMAPKMKSAMTKVCTDDKWSADALKCMDDAKTEDEMKKCDDKLSADQKAHMEKAMGEAMGMPKMGGDEGKPGGDEGSAGGSAAAGGSAEGSAAAGGEGGSAAAAGGGGNLPKECQDYQAAIEKLASCDKLPQATRDSLKKAYDTASAAWANVPDSAKASLATGCKAGADAVTNAGKQVCGW